jgi:hypothetical protein
MTRNGFKIVIGRIDGNRPLRRIQDRWEGSVKMNHREIGYKDRDEIEFPRLHS